MKLRAHILVLLMPALIAGGPISGFCAADVTNQFETANRLYQQGKSDEAITAYQRLLEHGVVAPALYFNLGNAYFKSGQLGRAIAAYRMAQQLSPRDPDIRANLQFARNQVQPPTFPANKLAQWLGTFTLNEWTTFAAAVFWVFFVLLAVGEARPQLKRRTRPCIWFAGSAFVILAACLVTAHVAQRNATRIAIIVEPEVAVRQGPLDDAPKAFVAHDGAELKVLDQKDDWLQVSVAPGRFGWVNRAAVVIPDTIQNTPSALKINRPN